MDKKHASILTQSRYLPGFVSGIAIQSKPVAAAAAAAKIRKPGN
jgi:hypothetical protein